MSFLGFLGKTLIGGVTGFLTGGPAGAVIGGVTSAVGGSRAPSTGSGSLSSSALPMSTLGRFAAPTQIRGFTAIGNAMPGTGPGPMPGVGGGTSSTAPRVSSAGGTVAKDASGSCPAGYHPGKQKSMLHPFGGCVKNRHMNVTNPKALRRALRRAYGFEKLAMRTIRLIHPKKRASFGGFKKSRARR